LYAQRIKALFDDTALATAMGTAARVRVEQYFDIEKIAQQNIDFYQRMVSRF
jgi:glycosyltransferase involved in cell wall biosynthesis